MAKINIALDGFAGCGKSTTARTVAARLGYLFLDTGSMYRAFTYHLQQHGISPEDVPAVEHLLQDTHLTFRLNEDGERECLLNGTLVNQELRTTAVNRQVSEVAAIKAVRMAMVAQQQRIATHRGVVMDGRDIGTVVLPDAELKVFMTASLGVRIQRRYEELTKSGNIVTIDEVRQMLLHRDHIDTTRITSPLRRAKDARLLDTTLLTFPQQVEQVMAWALELGAP